LVRRNDQAGVAARRLFARFVDAARLVPGRAHDLVRTIHGVRPRARHIMLDLRWR
jgi:hypothetical protein